MQRSPAQKISLAGGSLAGGTLVARLRNWRPRRPCRAEGRSEAHNSAARHSAADRSAARTGLVEGRWVARSCSAVGRTVAHSHPAEGRTGPVQSGRRAADRPEGHSTAGTCHHPLAAGYTG